MEMRLKMLSVIAKSKLVHFLGGIIIIIAIGGITTVVICNKRRKVVQIVDIYDVLELSAYREFFEQMEV
jgi:predicted glycosyltransferase